MVRHTQDPRTDPSEAPQPRKAHPLAIAHPPVLIGLYSPAQGMGKSTVAQLLLQRLPKGKTFLTSFANPIKQAGAAFLEALGYEDHAATSAIYDRKDDPLPEWEEFCGRDVLEMIGEGARAKFGGDVWVNALFEQADYWRGKKRNVIIDDVRRPNEAVAVLLRGGHLICIEGPVRYGKHAMTSRTTEGQLDGYRFATTIHNTAGLPALEESTRAALALIRGSRSAAA